LVSNGDAVRGARFSVLGSRFAVRGSRFAVRGSRLSDFGFRISVQEVVVGDMALLAQQGVLAGRIEKCSEAEGAAAG
jgi:hypothetical protein